MSRVSTWRSGSSSFAPADPDVNASALATPRRATARNPRTWSCRSLLLRPASGLGECSVRRCHSHTEHARSPVRSQSSSVGARAGPTVERASARREAQTAPPHSVLQMFGENESRTARRSFFDSPASRTPFDSGPKCPVRRPSDHFVQLTDLALGTSHRIVGSNLGFSQERHLPRILVSLACTAECQRIAVQAKRVGSFSAQRGEQRLQLLAPTLELGCAFSQVAVFPDVARARLRRQEDAEFLLPARSRPVRRSPHPCGSRSGVFYDRANDLVSSTLRPLCKYLPHESGRTQERHRVRLAATHPSTRMSLAAASRC